MEINNSPIFNPAAIVQTAGGPVSGPVPNKATHQEHTSRTLSQATILSFANGVPKLSAESAQAIANGALPPELIIPEDKATDALKAAIDQTVGLQTQTPEPVNDDVIVELSNAAKGLSVQQQSSANEAKIATINAAINAFSGPDVATAALGNDAGGTVNVVV